MNARTLFFAGCLVALGLGACTSKTETPATDSTTVIHTDSAVITPAPDTTHVDTLKHDSVVTTTTTGTKKTTTKTATTTVGKTAVGTGSQAPAAPTEYQAHSRSGAAAPKDTAKSYQAHHR